jgi:hypothetical protein
MDHRGLRARLTGAGCTSCGTAILVGRIAVLAERGDAGTMGRFPAAWTGGLPSPV